MSFVLTSRSHQEIYGEAGRFCTIGAILGLGIISRYSLGADSNTPKPSLGGDGVGKFVLALILTISCSGFAEALDAIQLRIKPYSELGFPVAKSEVNWMLQTAVDKLYGRAYSDLGDFSDFMHGHLFTPTGSTEPLLIIFHTKEFDFLRKGVPYQGIDGNLPNLLDRNWLMWLKDNPLGRRGEFVDAHTMSVWPQALDKPISPSDLNPALFSGVKDENNETSVYFFRVACDHPVTAENNLIEVFQGSDHQRVCLALMDWYCRVHSLDNAEKCGSTDVVAQVKPNWYQQMVSQLTN